MGPGHLAGRICRTYLRDLARSARKQVGLSGGKMGIRAFKSGWALRTFFFVFFSPGTLCKSHAVACSDALGSMYKQILKCIIHGGDRGLHSARVVCVGGEWRSATKKKHD